MSVLAGSAKHPVASMMAMAFAAVGMCLVQVPGVSQAANFSMTGKYRDQRGQITIPLPPSLFAGGRGVPGSGTITQTGAAVPGGGPATIGIPANVFFDPAQPGGFLIPVPGVIQLTTSAQHQGPTIPATFMALRTGPASFSFCPGAAANPICTTKAAGGSQGTLNGIVRYTPGPNRFGGTFKMLASGPAILTNKGGPQPSTVMTLMGATKAALPFSALNAALGGTTIIAAGRAYSTMVYFYLDATPPTHPYGYMATPKGLLSRGPELGTGVSVTAQNTGFPMTTGQIYLYRTIGTQATSGAPASKHTVTGYDKRTAGGAGRISLVSGSLSRTYPGDGSNPPEGSATNRSLLTMTFVQQPALSLASPALLICLAALILLTAGYAVTVRGRTV